MKAPIGTSPFFGPSRRVTLACIALLLSMMNSACAQSLRPKTTAQRVAHHTQVLKRELNLNDRQTAAVHVVLLSQANRMDSLKRSARTNRRLTRLTHRRIKFETERRMEAILSAEQQPRYASWKSARKERRAARMHHAG